MEDAGFTINGRMQSSSLKEEDMDIFVLFRQWLAELGYIK